MTSTKKHRTSIFSNPDGQDIFYRNWTTDCRPKAIILIVHGLNAHSGYYQNFATELNENAYEVYAIDLPGHGRSAGERYYLTDYQDIVKDVVLLLNIAKCAHPTVPIFLFGHCAGGVFASIYALRHQLELKGLIAESCTLQFAMSAALQYIIKILGDVMPHLGLIRLKPGCFSRDPLMVDKMINDVLLGNKKLPVKTVQQLLVAAEYLKNEIPQLKLPLLILHGTADEVTKPAGSGYLMEYASSADKQLKLYEGHYHDLLNDKYNGIIKRDIMHWLNERT